MKERVNGLAGIDHVLHSRGNSSERAERNSDRHYLLTRSGILVVFAVAIAGAIGATAVLSTQTSFSNVGRMKSINVEVYSEASCNTPMTELDWDIIAPGGEKTVVIYVKNTGNSPMNLIMSIENWDPPDASDFLSVTWDQEGTVLGEDESVEARVILSVDPSIDGVDNFSFDITIIGKG